MAQIVPNKRSDCIKGEAVRNGARRKAASTHVLDPRALEAVRVMAPRQLRGCHRLTSLSAGWQNYLLAEGTGPYDAPL
jgi:hypothetical protein